ncbi:CPBP family intramembrane glutamic endopeptidase [Marinobacterium arenosum]|uniref:CPBP family intramembrane glutamic endopeptidase n=1 Tax=Marinobacterium arenosum TaxID=2862496 RepID=UPI001C988C22|nr:CPBP family intramembrane glutamic endopeptidase [Marinobacterium arenosum]MBY4676237.1 CPBP family intramembrane metalloprotease [Marinobacterium arenosum]
MELQVVTERSLWLSLTVSFIAAVAVVLLGIYAEVDQASPLARIGLLLGTVPLATLLFALGSGPVRAFVTERFNKPAAAQQAAGLLALCLALTGIGSGFDPYFWLLMCGLFAGLLLGMRRLKQQQVGWLDLLAWLALLIPFDYRLTSQQWFGAPGFAYVWWSIAVSVLLLLVWRESRRLPGLNMWLVPQWRDLLIGFGVAAAALLVLVPLGLAFGFLHWNPPATVDIGRALGLFVGLFVSVAIPEELFFRGVLMMGLIQLTGRPLLAILLSSLAFGIFHWNRVDTLQLQLAYCALATIAGLAYAYAYRKSRNNLLAPVLTHSAVDWVWKMFFIA